MPNARLIVDGHVVMDSDTTNWVRRPPAELTELTSRGQAKPWHKAAMIALADAVTAHRDIEIVIATNPTGWTLTVSHTPALFAPVTTINRLGELRAD